MDKEKSIIFEGLSSEATISKLELRNDKN